MIKPTKWLCPQRRLRVFAVRMEKAWVLSYPLSAQRRLWSDWADVHSDLSLRWAHSHIVGFVMSRLKWANAWVLSYPLSAQRRLWSDWAVVHSDLSLRWAHSHIVGFVMSRLKLASDFSEISCTDWRSKNEPAHEIMALLSSVNSFFKRVFADIQWS